MSYIKCCLLASGSAGNCIYLETTQTKVLIDAGLSGKEIKSRLSAIDVNPADLQALIITHEHQDHIKGAGVLARQFNLPLFMTCATEKAVKLGKIPKVTIFSAGEGFAVNDFYFQSFSVPHDAADPVGFIIQNGKYKIGLATDMGQVTKLVAQRLLGVHLLILETNHDERLLQESAYPWSLKQRIRSSQGHLSNRQAALALKSWLGYNLRQVFLAHLSEVNNRPALAYQTINQVVKQSGGADLTVSLTQQDKVSEVVFWK